MSSKTENLFRDYSNDLERYLNDKLGDRISESEGMEISEYIVNKVGNFMCDWYVEQERIAANRMKRVYGRDYRPAEEKEYKEI